MMEYEYLIKSNKIYRMSEIEVLAAYKTMFSITLDQYKIIYRGSTSKEQVAEEMKYCTPMVEDTFLARTGMEEKQLRIMNHYLKLEGNKEY